MISMYAVLNLLGLSVSSSSKDIVDTIQSGFSQNNFNKVKSALGFNDAEMAKVLSLSESSLTRMKSLNKFSSTSSDRLFKLAEAAAFGLIVFNGSHNHLKKWLKTNLKPFDGKRPLDYMTNHYGIDMVIQALGRIEHGIYS